MRNGNIRIAGMERAGGIGINAGTAGKVSSMMIHASVKGQLRVEAILCAHGGKEREES